MNLIRAMFRPFLALTLLFGIVTLGTCQESEQNIKAAFLYNFTKYVTWPPGTFESPSSPIIIGVVGSDSLNGALELAVSDKTVDGRRVVVRYYRWNQDLSTCQVLFVPSAEMANAGQLAKNRQQPVLTVGEASGFARKFGMINFVIEANRVRFEINGKTAKDSGLTISSKLLKLGIQPK